MSEEMKHGYSNPGHSGDEAGFEREDLGSRGVFAFMIGLAVVGVVIYFIISGMYSFLDKYERSQMATASPLAPSTEVTSRHIDFAPGHGDYVDEKFKNNGAPILEYDERGQFRDFLMNQENQLNSYGWVDENAGVAHIPIERAMELTVQRGMPVYSQSSAGLAASAPGNAPAKKRAASKQ
jgi:hypothetical protein